MAEENDPRLEREIGPLMLAVYGAGTILGAGIYVLIGLGNVLWAAGQSGMAPKSGSAIPRSRASCLGSGSSSRSPKSLDASSFKAAVIKRVINQRTHRCLAEH